MTDKRGRNETRVPSGPFHALLAATLAFTGNGEMAFAAEPPKVAGDGNHVALRQTPKAKQARKLPRPCFAKAVSRSAKHRKRNRMRCALKLSRVKWKHSGARRSAIHRRSHVKRIGRASPRAKALPSPRFGTAKPAAKPVNAARIPKARRKHTALLAGLANHQRPQVHRADRNPKAVRRAAPPPSVLAWSPWQPDQANDPQVTGAAIATQVAASAMPTTIRASRSIYGPPAPRSPPTIRSDLPPYIPYQGPLGSSPPVSRSTAPPVRPVDLLASRRAESDASDDLYNHAARAMAVLGQLEAEDRDFLWSSRAPAVPSNTAPAPQNALATEDAKLPALYPAPTSPGTEKNNQAPRAIALDTGVQTPLAGRPKPAALTLQSNPSGSITQQAFPTEPARPKSTVSRLAERLPEPAFGKIHIYEVPPTPAAATPLAKETAATGTSAAISAPSAQPLAAAVTEPPPPRHVADRTLAMHRSDLVRPVFGLPSPGLPAPMPASALSTSPVRASAGAVPRSGVLGPIPVIAEDDELILQNETQNGEMRDTVIAYGLR